MKSPPLRRKKSARVGAVLYSAVSSLVEEEAYTVFCIGIAMVADDGTPLRTENWLRQIAAKSPRC